MFDEEEIWNYKPSEKILNLQQQIVNELKPKQQDKVKELKVLVKDELKPHHNDFFLLKWLKARKFDVSSAENMLRAHLRWREEFRVDFIHKEYKPPEVLKKYCPLGSLGEDKDGCPAFLVYYGNLDVKGVSYSSTRSENEKFYIYALEYMEQAKIFQSEKHGRVISTVTCIMDADHFQLQDYIWKPVYEFTAATMKMYEANYPENLKKGFVINAPKIFTVFFNMVKPFFSEDTVSKLRVMGKDCWKEVLLKEFKPNQLPKYWGGDLVDEIDGNPYCSSKITIGGKVPNSYYTVPLRERKSLELKTIDVARSGLEKVTIEVKKPGYTLRWLFETVDHDIAFSVLFRRNNQNKDVKLVRNQKANCFLVPEEGSLVCKESGVYSLVFDNTYSWYRSKKVFYNFEAFPPASQII